MKWSKSEEKFGITIREFSFDDILKSSTHDNRVNPESLKDEMMSQFNEEIETDVRYSKSS